jgi:hypothetical protein
MKDLILSDLGSAVRSAEGIISARVKLNFVLFLHHSS